MEFGYCFDVSIRAFFPLWALLYVVQFILMPLITKSTSPSTSFGNALSTFVGNTLYLLAFGYWTIITFLGYNALAFLHHTELLLAPIGLWLFVWAFTVVGGVNLPNWGAGWLLAGVRKLGS